MKVISIINLKGGVGKTISSCNMAHILATVHHYKVLLVDNDKQGNASKLFSRYNENRTGTAEILVNEGLKTESVIQKTAYENIDILTANMELVMANFAITSDGEREQLTRLKTALEQVKEKYDFCIIDNAPDINMYTLNALVASDEYMMPLTIDNFALEGIKVLLKQVDMVRAYNKDLVFRGVLITQWQNNDINRDGETWLHEDKSYQTFETHIRRSEKVRQSIFAEKPILEYSKRSAAAKDYLKFVEEYLKRINVH